MECYLVFIEIIVSLRDKVNIFYDTNKENCYFPVDGANVR